MDELLEEARAYLESKGVSPEVKYKVLNFMLDACGHGMNKVYSKMLDKYRGDMSCTTKKS